MAQSLGSTTTAVAETANEFLRQGLSQSETNDMIVASQYLSKLGMIESADATQYLTSATKGYGIEASNAMSIVDKFTNIDMHAAVSAGYMAEAFSHTSASAQQAGVDFDTLNGYIATVGETTQKTSSVVGEAFKSMFARYSNVKAGKFAAEGENMENLNNVETVLKYVKPLVHIEIFQMFLMTLQDVGIVCHKLNRTLLQQLWVALIKERIFLFLCKTMTKH